jgi:hypothetical protein
VHVLYLLVDNECEPNQNNGGRELHGYEHTSH